MDAFIAATAQRHDLTLVTRNVSDFASLALYGCSILGSNGETAGAKMRRIQGRLLLLCQDEVVKRSPC